MSKLAFCSQIYILIEKILQKPDTYCLNYSSLLPRPWLAIKREDHILERLKWGGREIHKFPQFKKRVLKCNIILRMTDSTVGGVRPNGRTYKSKSSKSSRTRHFVPEDSSPEFSPSESPW